MASERNTPKENQPLLGVMTASRLPAGSHLVLQGIRLWQAAFIEKNACLPPCTRPSPISTAPRQFAT